MEEAGKAPSLSDDFRSAASSLDGRLVNYLLKAGERQSVADFLERAAAINASQKEQLIKAAAAVRAGRMPMSYQSMFK
jgi:hypothetical protein